MNNDQVNMYMLANNGYFPAESIPYVRERLAALDEEKSNYIYALNLKDPTIYLLISIFLGGMGVDRFLMGDVVMGVLKLLTGGLCGILWIIDIVGIQKNVREDNLNKLMQMINF